MWAAKIAGVGIIAAGIVYGGYRMQHYDIMGLCPMALDFIKLDTGASGYEKALAGWKDFAAYYNCEPQKDETR